MQKEGLIYNKLLFCTYRICENRLQIRSISVHSKGLFFRCSFRNIVIDLTGKYEYNYVYLLGKCTLVKGINMLSKMDNLDSCRRDAILNAALKEFAKNGFDEASTNIMAKEAGISKGLMFHYVNNKKDLFLYLYDYCSEMVNKEYLEVMNFDEKDTIERLRQSYLLQIELMQKHPWIFEFINMTATPMSEEIQKELEKRAGRKQSLCYESMFEIADADSFKEGLDVKRCRQLIYWANIGFTNQILEDIRNTERKDLDYDHIIAELDGHLKELRKIFYK